MMGSCAALMLARLGFAVTLIDAAQQPMAGASRWNEGKIHLGYLYNADPSLASARHVLSQSLTFRPLIEQYLGVSIQTLISQTDDVYLCHRDSVVDPGIMGDRFLAVDEMVRNHPQANSYLVDVSDAHSRRLSDEELSSITNAPDILAGFKVPERSVSTIAIAELMVAALKRESGVIQLVNTKVSGLRSMHANHQGPWVVETMNGEIGSFDFVVNALWEGKLSIDNQLGLMPRSVWSHRYRRALFVHTSEPVEQPCVVIATGPFGDVKNYNGRDFYLSWYPRGLAAYGTEIAPPDIEELSVGDRERLANDVFDTLQQFLPGVKNIRDKAKSVQVGGGWVYAAGQGRLCDPSSSLHRRSDYGVVESGRYFSVDTGKYASAPFLAQLLTKRIEQLNRKN